MKRKQERLKRFLLYGYIIVQRINDDDEDDNDDDDDDND